MKHLILIAALTCASAAHAEKGARRSGDEVCKDWGDFAVRVMTMRQKQTPMHETMATIPTTGNIGAYKAIVMDAYESRSYTKKDMQDQSIASFRNTVELACYKRPK
ncbi:hypothetical protein ACLBWS_18090 [Brucellaceae bacterium D45D]